MIKVIATDMDGTFLRSDKTYDKARFSSLLTLMEKYDIKFVAASGNLYDQLLLNFLEYPNRIAYVAENGGRVIDQDGTLLKETYLSNDTVAAVLSYLYQNYPETLISLSGEKRSYLERRTPINRRTELEYYMPNFIYKDHLLPLDDDRYFQMTLWVNENLVSEMLLDISEHFKNHHIRLTSSGFGCIDVLPADVNKADGIAILLEKWGLKQDQVMVFGDGGNDVEMLRAANISYAMSNAPEEIKAIAKYQTVSNDQDGVLETIGNFLHKMSDNE
ncbi:TPA: Cof-type HAD-IIB family hydrolase [Streptococcus agalactiae]